MGLGKLTRQPVIPSRFTSAFRRDEICTLTASAWSIIRCEARFAAPTDVAVQSSLTELRNARCSNRRLLTPAVSRRTSVPASITASHALVSSPRGHLPVAFDVVSDSR
jgi:hypothetical protein